MEVEEEELNEDKVEKAEESQEVAKEKMGGKDGGG